MTSRHSPLTAEEVIAGGGWHPRYARVIALASDDGYGFALVDGNGDGSELEAEAWTRRDGTWGCGFSSGAGPLDRVEPIRAGGQVDETAWFAYGSAPGRDTVTIAFDAGLHVVPVGEHGVWAFIAARPGRSGRDDPVLADGQNRHLRAAAQDPRPGCKFMPIGGTARTVTLFNSHLSA